MKKIFVCLPFLFAATVDAAAPLAAPPPAEIAEAQLRALHHRFVNAFMVADTVFMDSLTADDFLLTTTSGEWLDRVRHLEIMSKAAVSNVSYDDVQVRLFGAVAVVHGLFEAFNDPNLIRVRFTDVYQWNGERWRLISAHNTKLRDGVAKAPTRGVKPQSATWQGKDPVGDDLEVLRALNASYVQAFREADVAWYEAHLAPDYLVINGDGSQHDRAQALTEFAKPSFATSMSSFPVDKVQIRRFGDIALIHAENAYQRKDGRRGISRYTDIWHKQEGGRWLCVAAHITVHQAPA